jgi:hypothetical protein
MTATSRRVCSIVFGITAVGVLAIVRPDEPSIEQYRQMGALAAYWVVGSPAIGLIMLVGAAILWCLPQAKSAGDAGER